MSETIGNSRTWRLVALSVAVVGCLASSQVTRAGTIDGGGGNQFELEVVSIAKMISYFVETHRGPFNGIESGSFRKAVANTTVRITDENLFVPGIETPRVMVNSAKKSEILVNARLYQDLRQNWELNVGTIYHEYLGILGLEKNAYGVSADFLMSLIKSRQRLYAPDKFQFSIEIYKHDSLGGAPVWRCHREVDMVLKHGAPQELVKFKCDEGPNAQLDLELKVWRGTWYSPAPHDSVNAAIDISDNGGKLNAGELIVNDVESGYGFSCFDLKNPAFDRASAYRACYKFKSVLVGN